MVYMFLVIMELITSYASDHSDSESDNAKNSEKLENDFFNLDESDSEDNFTENDSKDIVCQAAQLKDKPYGPSKDFFPTHNEKNNELSFYKCQFHESSAPRCNKRTIDEVYAVDICTTKAAKESNSMESIFTENSSCNIPDKNFIPKKINYSFQGHDSAISSLHWNYRYSNLLLSSSMDHTCKIWNIYLQKPVRTFNEGFSIKSAKWMLCGKEIVYGGYSKKTTIVDVDSGTNLITFDAKDFVSCVQIHPELPDVILIGTKDNVLAFDKRSNNHKPIRTFSSNCQYVLDLAFMKKGAEFVASTEVVSHDSADRTIMIWDFGSGAILSNQIYNERYTCPCIKISPDEKHFVAQSNGNYIAVFSTKRPYKLQNRRFTGHEVAGYNISCDFSPDSQILVSGDAKGALYFYKSYNCNLIKRLEGKCETPALQVQWHPCKKSTVSAAYWDGLIQIWQ